MKRLLFICHVEPMFDHVFDQSFLIRLGFEAAKYDRVIVLNSEIGEPGQLGETEFSWPSTFEQWHWSWGYEEGMFECNKRCGKCKDCRDEGFLIESSGHEWTWVPPEARKFPWKKYEVTICGGCDSECLQDWRAVLSHLSVEYSELRQCVY